VGVDRKCDGHKSVVGVDRKCDGHKSVVGVDRKCDRHTHLHLHIHTTVFGNSMKLCKHSCNSNFYANFF